jgi:hypothetical protein
MSRSGDRGQRQFASMRDLVGLDMDGSHAGYDEADQKRWHRRRGRRRLKAQLRSEPHEPDVHPREVTA